jgi:hypothetical protein
MCDCMNYNFAFLRLGFKDVDFKMSCHPVEFVREIDGSSIFCMSSFHSDHRY